VAQRGLAACRARLERDGLLLQADAALPSVVGIVAGGPVRGSWWGHPAGRAIHGVNVAMANRDDVVAAKLVDGKVTLVHRRLWPALLAVAQSGEPWQVDGLSRAEEALLARVRRGAVRSDREPSLGGTESAERVRALERRLLVRADEVHTESGAHAKVLEPWAAWARRVGVAADRDLARAWERERGARARLPWEARPARRARRRSTRPGGGLHLA
jgi:hypothetical protein